MKVPRPFKNEHDLSAMYEVLEQGRMADNGTYYVHTGDLKWWLFYPPLSGALWDHIYLWDDPDNAGRLLGWALITPDWVGMDVYTQPELRSSMLARDMYLWAEEKASQVARQTGKQAIHALWISHDDAVLVDQFTRQGFRLVGGLTHLERDLVEEVGAAGLTDGFILRGSKGLLEVSERARAQYETFGSKAQYAQYEARFVEFMRSAVYQPELDIVVVSRDEQIASFCNVWIDFTNHVGLFEPVGTRPHFQRKGLGKAIMQEGLRRLQECGVKRAIVSTYDDNPATIDFYKSVGFHIVRKLGTFEKDV